MQSPIKDIIQPDKNRKNKLDLSFQQVKVVSNKIEKINPSVLMVTSLTRGNSSLITTELAAALALRGKKVLLVDADLENPSVHVWFSLSARNGLSNLSKEQVHSYIQPTFINGLDLLPAGSSPASRIDIWLSQSLVQSVADWQGAYDHILFSAPALHKDGEAELIAEICQETLLVVRERKDKLAAVKNAKHTLEKTNCQLLGMVYQRK